MLKTYKYNPKDFEGIQHMSDDLTTFYHALEKYNTNKNFDNEITLRDAIEDVELTLKHRTLDGHINPGLADEIDNYIGGLIRNA